MVTGSPRAENFAASLLPNCSISLKLHTKFVVYFGGGFLLLFSLVPPVALGILAGIIMRWKDNKKQ